MKLQSHKETFLQAVIIITCVLIIYFTHFVGSVSSQSCTVIPPLYTDRNPYAWSWPSGKTVNVIIDDQWNTTERQAFASGNAKWNNWNSYNCSGITFTGFGSQHFTDVNTPAPDFTVYWQKTDPHNNGHNAAVRANFGGIPRRIISGNEWVAPTASNTNSYFNYLGTHEMGHTFGLADCLCSNQCTCSPNQSIMSGQSNDPVKDSGGPSACDNTNIQKIYCPHPTPTPTPTALQDCMAGGDLWSYAENACL